MAQLIRAILLAEAMATSILGFFAIIRANHEPLRVDLRLRQASRDMAPVIWSRRISVSPAFDTRPNRSLPSKSIALEQN